MAVSARTYSGSAASVPSAGSARRTISRSCGERRRTGSPTIMARMDFEPNQFFRVPSSRILRAFLGLVVLAALAGLFWWRRGSLTTIGSAFSAVKWEWVVLAIALNLLSVIARALAWTT